MRRFRVSFRLAFAVSLLGLLVLSAGATAAGYLIETHGQRVDRSRRLAGAADYVRRGVARAETESWQRALAARLAALGLEAQLILALPDGKRAVYVSKGFLERSSAKEVSPSGGRVVTSTQPTRRYTFPLAARSSRALVLDLYAPAFDQSRRLLIALAAGLVALLAGLTLLLLAASRWLVTPLRQLSANVDAIAGGDRVERHPTSPIREVENVAAAVEGTAARLAQTAEHDAQLESERRLLVSSVAHDLRTPLFALRGYLDAIATGLGDPHERLDRARTKAQQIDRLVTSLFDYAREDLDGRPRLQVADLAAAVTDAAAAFEFAAEERAVELRVNAPARGPAVTIDRDGFERALANVIDNALRHTPQGGAVDVTCGEDADGAFVRVVDDGPGIAPDMLSRVFEPMIRADSARNSRTGGAGLGLAIASRLLQTQGGTIRAENTSERGAILTLRLPPRNST
jgi:signal transduction histidine kinase